MRGSTIISPIVSMAKVYQYAALVFDMAMEAVVFESKEEEEEKVPSGFVGCLGRFFGRDGNRQTAVIHPFLCPCRCRCR